VRRAHSGPYGMVNSEEGFGNLSRFLFGDLRVDGELEVEDIALPPAVEEARAAGQRIRASYTFESFLRVRGERWAMTERLARDGTATFRRFDELFDTQTPGLVLSEEQERNKRLHRRIDMFTAFLDPMNRAEAERVEKLANEETAVNAMGFAFRLRIAVPEYTVDGLLWRKDLYEGSALLDRDLAFLAYKDGQGTWQLAWGANVVGDGHLVRVLPTDDEAKARQDLVAHRRETAGRIEFLLPLAEYQQPYKPGDKPIVMVWLKLTARLVDDKPTPTS
jgi:hypothetical protein